MRNKLYIGISLVITYVVAETLWLIFMPNDLIVPVFSTVMLIVSLLLLLGHAARANKLLRQRTDELNKRENYLRASIDNLPFFFWLKDAEHRFLAVNNVFAEACGRNPTDIVGLTDFDVWPHELAEGYRKDDIEVIASRKEKSVEEPVAGGSDAGWIETYKKPVITADGSILGTVGFARDITERKQLVDALAKSELRWQLALEGTNEGIWDWTPATGEVYFSEHWKTMLGYCTDEIGTSVDEWISRVHPDDLESTMAEVQRHLRGETELYQNEHRMRCKNGEYKWILDRGRAQFDEKGNAQRMVGSHTDITERKDAEARVIENAEQLSAIFSLSPDGFVSFDKAHCIKYVSPAFTHLTGLAEIDVLGITEDEFSTLLAGLCTPESRFSGIALQRAMQKVQACGNSECRQRIELAVAGKRVLEVSLRESKSEVVSQILYLRDITHETEVDHMKSEFLATAAHELRTPMASIYGFSEILLNQDFEVDERQELLGTIFKQSELMVSIINELLDLARIEARRGKDFTLTRFDLGDLLQEVMSGFKTPGERASPLLQLAAQKIVVRADRNKLTQALNNVISNAYKYSPEGGEVSVSLIQPKAAHDANTFAVGICIRDGGIGMTPEQLARVFERFYRADASGAIPGTGLGMSIVKEIIELHGGSVALESHVGKGTIVTLWLPTTQPTETSNAEILSLTESSQT